jgi:integrase
MASRPRLLPEPAPEKNLSRAVHDLIAASTAASTLRAYASDLDHFIAWGGTIPCPPETVAEYLAAHVERLAPATLVRRLAAIRRAHLCIDTATPTDTSVVRLTLRGIRRHYGSRQRKASPILTEDIALIVGGLGPSLRDRRDRAVLLLGFAGGFRRSELCALNCTDLEWNPGGLVVHLRRSKTDQEAHGRMVAIPPGQERLCPVTAVRNWLQSAGIERGAIFRSIDRHGNIAGTGLTGESVAEIIKSHALNAGLQGNNYSGHSLRSGFVTSAALAQVPTWSIKQQTGHRSEASFEGYIRNAFPLRKGAAPNLLGGTKTDDTY